MTTSFLFDLTGRVAIVTGGNGGIGRSIALGFAEAGAAVAVLGVSGTSMISKSQAETEVSLHFEG